MRNPHLIALPSIYLSDTSHAEQIDWLKKNAKPKWKYNRKKPARFHGSAVIIGVYLNGPDATAYKLKFIK